MGSGGTLQHQIQATCTDTSQGQLIGAPFEMRNWVRYQREAVESSARRKDSFGVARSSDPNTFSILYI